MKKSSNSGKMSEKRHSKKLARRTAQKRRVIDGVKLKQSHERQMKQLNELLQKAHADRQAAIARGETFEKSVEEELIDEVFGVKEKVDSP